MTLVVALLVLAAIALALALVIARPRGARIEAVEPLTGVATKPGPSERGPPLPVVLVHGLFGFTHMLPGQKLAYFRGIAHHLEGLGCVAHAVSLRAAGAVPERARGLAEAITALPHDRVDIIAHSLGGLDARFALAKLGLASRVRALVTIGTPHHGTPLADLATDGPLGAARGAIGKLGFKIPALDWLSTAALDKFNAEIVDVPGVRYACVVGGIRDAATQVPAAIALPHAYLRRVAGANDGLVPIASQYWGETLAEIEADHFAQIGWQIGARRTFDALGLYAFVIARLGDARSASAA